MRLPHPRGPISDVIVGYLHEPPDRTGELLPVEFGPRIRTTKPDVIICDDDIQLGLWMLYELHYRSFDDVADRYEWDPEVLRARARLEEVFETALNDYAHAAVTTAMRDESPLADQLFDITASFAGPPLAEHVQRRATRDQVLEFLALRSVYHLKEADPHSWGIPRLSGPAKAALVELQFDEYGDGRTQYIHQDLFGRTLRSVGLDDTYGAYVDIAPGSTLAISNAMSLFGLHRRLRGALMGHLAAFEATSSVPCRRFAAGLRRVGFDDDAALYFDEHIEADAVHEQLAVRGVCAVMAESEPYMRRDIILGAVTCLKLEALSAHHLLTAWAQEHRVAWR